MIAGRSFPGVVGDFAIGIADDVVDDSNVFDLP